ncbi:VOC family protein [Chitinasiproducens palmae]|uniref:Glyoxalase-like domain-containing protein n=1 Tax=Chitinasiproducens palmae TaxID=1770053 RepID=A0A1H2PP45_9BURK|nr:VOC family protein [Chitinasiproducens palmae]SDV48039.1 Glyoxalase-like domain-containing protein [Chitinasiproducens palmae]
MQEDIDLSIDHVGLAIEHLESGRAAFARLGFTLSPRSDHSGSPGPGMPVIPWGSGNHCAMFETGYFELIGLVDAAKFSNVKALLAQYQGLHIVALRCGNADRAFEALQSRGVLADPPRALERDAPFGPDNGETRRARFANVYLDTKANAEARFIVIEHRTPDVLWQPHLLSHENGARALSAVYFVADDAASLQARLLRVAGATASADGRELVLPGGGAFRPCAPDAFARLIPFECDAVPQRVAAAQIKVDSLDRLRALLDARGVDARLAPDPITSAPSVWVGPADACGTFLQFVA